jgi:hypothetical protein
MLIPEIAEYVPDRGRSLSEEERVNLEPLYRWPRPQQKLCRLEKTNDRWRLGRC